MLGHGTTSGNRQRSREKSPFEGDAQLDKELESKQEMIIDLQR